MLIHFKDEKPMKDLAPMIVRQRLVIEGIPKEGITDKQIKEYLSHLSTVLKMETLIEPITHRSDKYGWSGWIHWETSGAHFYAWEEPMLFFSVDIYTCKEFKVHDAVRFTEHYFAASKVVYRSF